MVITGLGRSGFADQLNKLRGPEPNGAHHAPRAPESEAQDGPQCKHGAERGSFGNGDKVYAGRLTATVRLDGGYVGRVSDGRTERDLRPGQTVTARTGVGSSYYSMTLYEYK